MCLRQMVPVFMKGIQKTCLYEDAIPLSAYLPMIAEVEAYDVMADTFFKGRCAYDKEKT